MGISISLANIDEKAVEKASLNMKEAISKSTFLPISLFSLEFASLALGIPISCYLVACMGYYFYTTTKGYKLDHTGEITLNKNN